MWTPVPGLSTPLQEHWLLPRAPARSAFRALGEIHARGPAAGSEMRVLKGREGSGAGSVTSAAGDTAVTQPQGSRPSGDT